MAQDSAGGSFSAEREALPAVAAARPHGFPLPD